MSWLTNFLCSNAPLPDGRPLYGYKTSNDNYSELHDETRKAILKNNCGQAPTDLPALFCLYAAETFRREHVGGAWAWQTIFTPLTLKVPANSIISDWVERGLRYWRRPLLSNRCGNLYLMTVACEGGLPLRLLAREQTHLTSYFRVVLDQYYRAIQRNTDTAILIAQQQAHRVPKTLQQATVFQLAGQLIAHISELQPHIGQAADPIAALNQACPNWERQLPLRLDDNNAAALLRLLVTRSGELAAEHDARLYWQGRLRRDGAQWHVEKHLQMPELVSAKCLSSWFANGTAATAPRYRLLLQTDTSNAPVAWLTRIETAAGEAQFRREWLRPHGVRLSDAAVLSTHQLMLHDGTTATPLVVGDGEPWSEAPWIFIEHATAQTWHWLTEGSAHTRAEQAWVVAPAAFTIDTNAGTCAQVGSSDAVQRVVYQISGTVDVVTPQHERYRLRCRAQQDFIASFHLSGATLPLSGQTHPLYLGLPQLRVKDANGQPLPDADNWRRQWRAVGCEPSWRESHDATTYGQLWLRLVDAENCERCRRQVAVVPHSLHINTTLGAGKHDGVIHFSGLMGGRVTCLSAAGRLECDGNDVRLHCPPVTGQLPPPFTVQLNWAGADPVKLTLPYPQRGACFLWQGQPLPENTAIALDRLGAAQLLIQDAAGAGSYWLVCELVTDERQNADYSIKRFNERLPALHDGQLDMALWSWQTRIASLLATSRDLDAQVTVTVETGRTERLARVLVTRFDCGLKPECSVNQVTVPIADRARFGAAGATQLRCQMIPLWAPARDPIPLTRDADDGWRWTLPAQLEAGPWWILGYDGDWARFRPLLWTVFADASSDDQIAAGAEPEFSALADAIREYDERKRTAKLQRVLTTLGTDPNHPDWPLLLDAIRLTRDYPPQVLEVLQQLITQPPALALILFKADDDIFEIVWALARQMPFSWALVSVAVWRESATAHFNVLREALQSLEPDVLNTSIFDSFQTFRARAVLKRRYWSYLCDWLHERLFPQQPLTNSELTLLRRSPDDSLLEQSVNDALLALQGRHNTNAGTNAGWVTSNITIQQTTGIWLPTAIKPVPPYSAAVRYAPFLAAHHSLHGLATNNRLIYEFRIVRNFDRDWFDAAYAIALSRGLAQFL
jgi:hypothetical protein